MLNSKIVFPMIKQIFPQMIANEIVSVQPMILPSNDIFHMDYAYGMPFLTRKNQLEFKFK